MYYKRGVFILLLHIFSLFSFSQTIKVISYNDSLPICKVSVYNKNMLIGQTDTLGKFKFKKNNTEIKLSLLGYKDLLIKKILNDTVIKLIIENNEIETVVINNKRKKSLFEKTLNSIYVGETNFSFKQKGLVKFKNYNKRLKKIRIEVCDVFGVKNLKYKPFKMGIYETDSTYSKLGKQLFLSEVLNKINNKKYFDININQNFNINTDYFFVTFEILDISYYKPEFINSKVGKIAAVPSVKLLNNNENTSYRLTYNTISDELVRVEKIESNFNIKILYYE